MNEQKIKEVFSDKAFVESLLKIEEPAEAQKALAAKGIEISVDEVKTVAELLNKHAAGSLSDAELENVAGGSIITGFVIGAIIAGGAGAAYTAYQFKDIIRSIRW